MQPNVNVPDAQPRRPRPGWVTASAVILLVVGMLAALTGLLLLAMGLLMGSVWTDAFRVQSTQPSLSPEALSRMMTGVSIAMGAIAGAWALGTLLAGIGLLRGRGWARITGIVLSAIGLAVTGLAMLGMAFSVAMSSSMLNDPQFRDLYGSYDTGSALWAGTGIVIGFILPFAISYLVVLIALVRNGAYFTPIPPARPARQP